MAKTRKTNHLPFADKAMRRESDYEDCASRLKALADPDRLQIVTCLLAGQRSVSSLADDLGMAIDKVSHHLGVLRTAKLVETQRQGKFVIYSLAPGVTAKQVNSNGARTIDLGCCQLDLVQIALHKKRDSKTSRRKGDY
jgi:ArsR family transcriptional regulator